MRYMRSGDIYGEWKYMRGVEAHIENEIIHKEWRQTPGSKHTYGE